MDGGSECQDKRDELEMCHRIHNTSLQDTMPQNLPTYSPTHQQSQPPPIIHSTFPPIQGASYMPLDQGLSSPTQEHLKEWLHPYNQSYQHQIDGSVVPCGIIPPQLMQPNPTFGGGTFYIQPNINYPYIGNEIPPNFSYQNPPLNIPTTPTTIVTLHGASQFPQSSSALPNQLHGDTHNLGCSEDSYSKPKLPEHEKLTNTKESSLPPDDNPGLPLQDEVCPFHQHMSYWAEQLRTNRKTEMAKNEERFCFLKWVDGAFSNITVIPPGTGMWHQLNLEYLARVVTSQDGLLFPDSLVGTDSHTTMVNGLGVLGWTVGTLDAEAVMFGNPLSMPEIPKVVGVRLHGVLNKYATSTGNDQPNVANDKQ